MPGFSLFQEYRTRWEPRILADALLAGAVVAGRECGPVVGLYYWVFDVAAMAGIPILAALLAGVVLGVYVPRRRLPVVILSPLIVLAITVLVSLVVHPAHDVGRCVL
jgi:hypothetical protein